MSMTKQFDIALNTKHQGSQRTDILVNQGDTRSIVFNFRIYDDVSEINYDDVSSAVLVVLKPDTNSVVQTLERRAGGGYTVVLSQQANAVVGVATGSLALYDSTDARITTLNFTFLVGRDNILETIESATEFDALKRAIALLESTLRLYEEFPRLKVLGSFQTEAQLISAFPDGSSLDGGFFVGIGTNARYFYWDRLNNRWANADPWRGDAGFGIHVVAGPRTAQQLHDMGVRVNDSILVTFQATHPGHTVAGTTRPLGEILTRTGEAIASTSFTVSGNIRGVQGAPGIPGATGEPGTFLVVTAAAITGVPGGFVINDTSIPSPIPEGFTFALRFNASSTLTPTLSVNGSPLERVGFITLGRWRGHQFAPMESFSPPDQLLPFGRAVVVKYSHNVEGVNRENVWAILDAQANNNPHDGSNALFTSGGAFLLRESLQNQIASIAAGVAFQSSWNPTTNTPELPDAPTQGGMYWIAGAAGERFGLSFEPGDWLVARADLTWDVIPITLAIKTLVDEKQDKIQILGHHNILTAPDTFGGQPGAVEISTIMRTPHARNTFAYFEPGGISPTGQVRGDIPYAPTVERVDETHWGETWGHNPNPDRNMLRLRYNCAGNGNDGSQSDNGGRMVQEVHNSRTGQTAFLKLGESGGIQASGHGRSTITDFATDMRTQFARTFATGNSFSGIHQNAVSLLTDDANFQLNQWAQLHLSGHAGKFMYNWARDVMSGNSHKEMHGSAAHQMFDFARAFMSGFTSDQMHNFAQRFMSEHSTHHQRGHDPNRNTPFDDTPLWEGGPATGFRRRRSAQPAEDGAFSALYDNIAFVMAGAIDDFMNDPNYPEEAKNAALVLWDTTRARLGVLNTSRFLTYNTADVQFGGNSETFGADGTLTHRSTNRNSGFGVDLMFESWDANTLVHFLAGTQFNVKGTGFFARDGKLFIGQSQAGDRPGSEGSLLRLVLTTDDLMALAEKLDNMMSPSGAVALNATETISAGRGTSPPQTATPITDFMRNYCEGLFSKEDAMELAKEIEAAAKEEKKRKAKEKAEREENHKKAIAAQKAHAKAMKKQAAERKKAEEKRIAKLEAENNERQLLREKDRQLHMIHIKRTIRAENKFHLTGTLDAHLQLEAIHAERAKEQAAFVKIANGIYETDNYTKINAKLDGMIEASEKREKAERKPFEKFITDWRIKADAEQAAREKEAQEAFDAIINQRVADGVAKALAAHGLNSEGA